MLLCYIDEAGDTGSLPAKTSPIQPVVIICGLAVEHVKLSDLTHRFIALKKNFFPNLIPQGRRYLDWMLREIKGAEIRKSVCSTDRGESRQAIGFLDKIVDLLTEYDVKIFGRVWIKEIGRAIRGHAIYTSSIQAICTTLQKLLIESRSSAFIIADSRNHSLNTRVAHSIFTRKFKSDGDDYPSIFELPAFGHSDNHAGLQLCDLVCSALLFPMATDAYCNGYVENLHVRPGYSILRDRYGSALSHLQYRYPENGRYRGGITTDDKLGQRSGALLFNPTYRQP